jgi:hypothetical protein
VGDAVHSVIRSTMESTIHSADLLVIVRLDERMIEPIQRSESPRRLGREKPVYSTKRTTSNTVVSVRVMQV